MTNLSSHNSPLFSRDNPALIEAAKAAIRKEKEDYEKKHGCLSPQYSDCDVDEATRKKIIRMLEDHVSYLAIQKQTGIKKAVICGIAQANGLGKSKYQW